MSAIRALVRQGVPGNVLAFHCERDCPAAWKAGRSAWCRASIRASLKAHRRPGRDSRSRESVYQRHVPVPA